MPSPPAEPRPSRVNSRSSLTRRRFLAGSAAALCALPARAQPTADLTAAELAPLRRESKLPIIDAHTHYAGEHPRVIQWMADHEVKLLTVAVAVQNDRWRDRAEVYRRLAQQHPARYAWCTSFTQPDFLQPEYADPAYVARVLREFEQDFAAGALGCKLWKSLGMSIQRPDGRYVQMDDPLFDPLYAWLAARQRTLLIHIADPLSAWLPLDARNTHRAYYESNPQWHMHGKKDRPHHSEIIAARDRVIARYPKLRVVGAHLGSLEYDVDELAKRFDQYPNFAVDTSGTGRIGDLGHQDRDKVRAFFLRYQDRLMFGTDRNATGQLTMAPRDLARSLALLRDALQIAWDFYATDRTVTVNGRPCRGLALPETVLKKLFSENARKWYPGL
jgi:predicted TIM-barrel fold metal-dependent hydrolase